MDIGSEWGALQVQGKVRGEGLRGAVRGLVDTLAAGCGLAQDEAAALGRVGLWRTDLWSVGTISVV